MVFHTADCKRVRPILAWQHRGIVWLPSEMVLADTEIAPSWDVTSDSIAAWLAHKLNAEKLILVKSLKPDAHSTAQDLVQQDLVDNAFPDLRMLI